MRNLSKFDGRLRPIYEYYSGCYAFSAAFAIYFYSDIFFPVHREFSVYPALVLLMFSIYKISLGNKVKQYQKNILRLPKYILEAKNIPTGKKKLFLGKGFLWTQKHTQRLIEARDRSAEYYLKMPKMFSLARSIEDFEDQSSRSVVTFFLYSLLRFTRWDSVLNPVRPLPPVGGKSEIHGVGIEDEKNVLMDNGERVGHTIVLGTTRVGKTRLAEIFITQDINRGDIVIVLDPKGDFELMARMRAEAERAGRLDQFHCFHLGYPDISERYNPIGEFSRITEVAGRMTSPLPSDGNAASFKEFAWRFSNVVARALNGIGEKPSYEAIAKYVTNIEPLLLEYVEFWLDKNRIKQWREKVQDIEMDELFFKGLPLSMRGKNTYAISIIELMKRENLYDPVVDGLRGIFEYDKTYYDKLTANLLPLIEKLTSGQIGDLLVPDYQNHADKRPILDWMSVIREGGIVYVGLDALSDHFVSSAVGSAMFSDLTSIAGRIYKHGDSLGLPELKGRVKKPISLHLDEFNELLSDDFIPMVNKAGGAGFQVTAYTQTGSDIEAGIGSRPKAGQIRGNFNTMIMLRVKEPYTADFMTQQLNRVRVYTRMEQSSSTDNNDPETNIDFTSQSTDRIMEQDVDIITNADLMALPKGQAFALLEGNNLYKLRLPLAAKDPLMFSSFEDFKTDRLKAYGIIL